MGPEHFNSVNRKGGAAPISSPLASGLHRPAKRLAKRVVEKPWGRRDLPACFVDGREQVQPTGEIWFNDPDRPYRALMVKFLFTSERLSIQVHPDKDAAGAAGYPSGKDEAWFIVKADSDAVIGLGLRESISPAALREAALDGTVVDLIDWRSAAAGDFYYSPAGTIHALGAGLMLIEVQQNVDLTYRLYDYGRDRELHLDKAIVAADLGPFRAADSQRKLGEQRLVLKENAEFVVERWAGPFEAMLEAAADDPVWIVPLVDGGAIDDVPLQFGDVWIADGRANIRIDTEAEVLVAYQESGYRSDLVGRPGS